jgi:hypothetical protein
VLLFADAADSEEPGDYVKLIGDLRAKGVTVSVIGLGRPPTWTRTCSWTSARGAAGASYFAETAYALPRLSRRRRSRIARAAYVPDPTPLSVSATWRCSARCRRSWRRRRRWAATT